MKRNHWYLAVLASCVLLLGCKDDVEEMRLTPAEKSRVLALQNPFGNDLVRLTNAANGTDVLVGMLGCKVYRAQPEQGVVTEWRRVNEVNDLNFLAAGCDRHEIRFDGTHVHVNYCTQAIGAGGGCGGGAGTYRSVNGIDWERKAKDAWTPVKSAPPPTQDTR